MNRNGNTSILGLVLLVVFAAAILVNGKYSPGTSTELITIQIDGIEDEVIAGKVNEMVQMIEGLQTIFIDEKTNLCTFRFDTGKTNLQFVESQLAGLGVKINPVKPVKITDAQDIRSKLLSIKIKPASDQ